MPDSTPPGRPRQALERATSRTGDHNQRSSSAPAPLPTMSSTSAVPVASRARRRRPTPADLLTVVQQLQPRDHVIAALLAEHRTLTTSQLAAVLFDAPSTARARLYRLRQLRWVDRFTPVHAGQRRQTHWVAGLLAARYHAVQNGTSTPTPRAWRDRVEGIAASTHLTHTRGANQVFIDLLAHARTHPDTQLARWWGSARTAAAVGQRVHPDGHGIWAEHDPDDGLQRQVGFWLEYDTGTEPLARLVAKLDPYARLHAAGGPDYPVLFHLPGPGREAHLHDLLAHRPPRHGVTVATTTPAAVATSPDGVTGSVWLLDGSPTRHRLIDLPSSPGQLGPYHPGPPTAEQHPLFLLAPPGRPDQRLVEGQPVVGRHLDDSQLVDGDARLVDGEPN